MTLAPPGSERHVCCWCHRRIHTSTFYSVRLDNRLRDPKLGDLCPECYRKMVKPNEAKHETAH